MLVLSGFRFSVFPCRRFRDFSRLSFALVAVPLWMRFVCGYCYGRRCRRGIPRRVLLRPGHPASSALAGGFAGDEAGWRRFVHSFCRMVLLGFDVGRAGAWTAFGGGVTKAGGIRRRCAGCFRLSFYWGLGIAGVCGFRRKVPLGLGGFVSVGFVAGCY